eukprot:TRINITY_DN60062_c0_g1_i1.p1 TRINITY_DN60062_c0_g1~~TRINITY_DN60062_c0_g1_i1.p1  ORF type:complete len:573 (+),score=172.28 TRINITY_DN60062_c0_g1_i1:106-1719(+)
MAAQGAALLAALASAAAERPLRAPLDKPNFVMLFVDDLGYGDVGFNGHPTVSTPNIDRLAHGGRILSTWYSGCPVCSGSRAALLTGRQFVRTGVPGVFGPKVGVGLPLNETTLAGHLKQAGYRTAIMGKWHLGQRPMYLPAARGFDNYLGIPYSDDMGNAQAQPKCGGGAGKEPVSESAQIWELYQGVGATLAQDPGAAVGNPPLPLVYQDATANATRIEEQPLQFRTVGEKYWAFVNSTIDEFKADPFFLYMPFSHVHATALTQPERQYSGCRFEGSTRRGKFGDALAEADWIIGELTDKLEKSNLDKNTLVLFTGDNGPWLIEGSSGGSMGLLIGRSAGYIDTGKATTWEGGIREAAFAYWPGQITPFSRTAEVVSSLDVFPTLSKLAGLPLPTDRVYDGRDASELLLHGGPSKHDFLFFYGTAASGVPQAVRYGPYKAHFVTAPGMMGGGSKKTYPADAPLLFNVEVDPGEAYPLQPTDYPDVVSAIAAAYHNETQGPNAMTFQKLVQPPATPGEDPSNWGICCDRSKQCKCSP